MVILFEYPSRIIEEDPTVKIPVILAFPFTYRDVPEEPTLPTSRENLGFVVPTPTLEIVLIPAEVLLQTGVKSVPSPRKV